MGKINTAKLTLVASAFLAATTLSTAASAQLDAQSPPVPRYHLVQLSIDNTKVSPQTFKNETRSIRSCGDAKTLAKTIDADFKRNRFVRATVLPEQLRKTLKAIPLGHATPVFSNDGSTMRVLVLCNPA